MVYNTIDNLTDLNLESTLSFPSIATPSFYPMILFALFLIVAMGSFFRELTREGKANLLSSLAVGGFVTTVVAVVMSFMNLIQTQVVVYAVVISVTFEVIYLLTARKFN